MTKENRVARMRMAAVPCLAAMLLFVAAFIR